MVYEVRNIVLSMEDIQSAYESYQRVTPGFLPSGKIRECKLVQDGVIVSVENNQQEPRQMTDKLCKGIDVLKPMIRFCIENNIMLPLDGKKSTIIDKDSIVLHIELNMSEELPTLFSPMLIKHMNDLAPHDAEKFVHRAR